MTTQDCAIWELFPFTCRWPTGVDRLGVQLFCGAPAALHLASHALRGAYCAAHGALAVRDSREAAAAAAPILTPVRAGRLTFLCDQVSAGR